MATIIGQIISSQGVSTARQKTSGGCTNGDLIRQACNVYPGCSALPFHTGIPLNLTRPCSALTPACLEYIEVESIGLINEIQGPHGHSHGELLVQDFTVKLPSEQLRFPHLLHPLGELSVQEKPAVSLQTKWVPKHPSGSWVK